jgi:hypothetical protein
MPQLMDKGHYGITVQNQANRSKGGAALLGLTDTDARRISQYLYLMWRCFRINRAHFSNARLGCGIITVRMM